MDCSDEQPGERVHKRIKHGRLNLARNTSPEDNLLDLERMSLIWSDPKLSDMAIRTKKREGRKRKDETFLAQMSFYYKDDNCDTASSDDDESNSDDDDDSDCDCDYNNNDVVENELDSSCEDE